MAGMILVVDDEIDMQKLLKRSLESAMDCKVETALSGEMALQMLAKSRFDLVLADIKMLGMSGLELLDLIKKDLPDLTVVIMTAYGEVETAVKAMRSGAYDFITKPFDHDALIVCLEKAFERSTLLRENLRLQKECWDIHAFQDLVGKSTRMKKVYETIQTKLLRVLQEKEIKPLGEQDELFDHMYCGVCGIRANPFFRVRVRDFTHARLCPVFPY